MRKILVCLLLLLFCAGTAYAAGNEPVIPKEFTLEKADDLSGMMISSFFDDVWKDLVGGQVDKGASRYSGVILAILGVLNFAAVLYLSAMVVYVWAITAATTAHEGYIIGGEKKHFHSLWVPLRQAGAFALSIPVFKGLSLMQIAVVACIGMSINMANVVWNYAAGAIVQSMDARTMDIFSRTMANDAYDVAPFIFQDLVIQRVFADYETRNKSKKIWKNDYSSLSEGYTGQKDRMSDEIVYPVNFDGKFDKEGKMLLKIDFEDGKIQIRTRATRVFPSVELATITVDFPRWKCSYLENGIFEQCRKPSGENYAVMEGVSLAMVRSILRFCGTLDGIAENYLKTDTGGCSVLNGATCTSGDDLGRAVTEKINAASKLYLLENRAAVDAIVKKDGLENTLKWKNMLASAMGLKNWQNDDVQSDFGWVSAGLFPIIVTSMDQRIRQGFDIKMGVGGHGDYGSFLTNFDKKYSYLDPRYRTAITNAGLFVLNYMLQDGYYAGKRMAQSDDETVIDTLKEALVKAFGGENGRHAGALGFVLKQAGKNDPVIILTDFGERILSAGQVLFVGGIGAKVTGFIARVVGYVSGSGAAAGEVANKVLSVAGSMAIAASISLITTGIFFAYVVPSLPAFFWIIAVFSWFFLIVETLVAAPFWVATHAATRGVGFAGNSARQGYLMLFDIMARPTLLVVGVVVAIILSQVAGFFIERMFNIWFSTSMAEMSFFGDIIYAIVVSSVLYYIYYRIFTTGVLYLPGRITKWCGQVSSRGFGREEAILDQTVTAGGATQQLKAAAVSASRVQGIGNKFLPRLRPGMK